MQSGQKGVTSPFDRSESKCGDFAPNTQAAAYLYASLLLLRADDDDRFALEKPKTAGATVDWDCADQAGRGAGPSHGKAMEIIARAPKGEPVVFPAISTSFAKPSCCRDHSCSGKPR